MRRRQKYYDLHRVRYGGRTRKMALVLAENVRLKEIVRRNKDTIEEITRELEESRRVMAKRTGVFFRFPTLPLELRQLVYGKLGLVDRITAVKTSKDMAAYFRKHRLNTTAEISLTVEDGAAFVKFQFGRDYIEMHRIPDELVGSVSFHTNEYYTETNRRESYNCRPTCIDRRDLQSSNKDCECDFCDENERAERYEDSVIEHYTYLAYNPRTIFDTFSLVNVTQLFIKSAPVGGLVDLLQPSVQLNQRVDTLLLTWHLEEGVRYVRNDPEFKVENWGKWFDFARPHSFYIDKNLRRFWGESDSEFAYSEDGPIVHIHKNLYDLPAIQNATRVEQEYCNVDINLQQLMNMKARVLLLCTTRSQLLSALDILQFFKAKVQQWIINPETRFSYVIRSAERSDRPHANHERLLEDVLDRLHHPDFLIYPGFCFNSYNGAPTTFYRNPNHISIRCVKTGTALVVTKHSLMSGVSYGPWPVQHGL